MTTLLEIRQKMRQFYQKNDKYVMPAGKFLLTLVSMLLINHNIGFYRTLASLPVTLIVAVLGAFLPMNLTILLEGVICLMHIYKASVMLLLIAVLILLVLYFLFARFTPELGYVLLAMPILYFLKIPYLMPILLGMISTPIAILTISCGTIVYYVMMVIKEAAALSNTMELSSVLNLYRTVIDKLLKNQMLIFSIVIFGLALFITYTIRRMRIQNAFDLSAAAGTLTCIIGFLIAYIVTGQGESILGMLLGALVSGALAWGIQFFRLALDYSRAENLQFEDEEYYYYVKAIPKIVIAQQEKQLKHISRKEQGRVISHTTGGKKVTVEDGEDPEEKFLKDFAQKEMREHQEKGNRPLHS